MPELPEVETVCAYLRETLPGRTITGAQVYLPRLLKNTDGLAFAAAVAGRSFQDVFRKGKYIFLRLDGPESLLVHLRMTGRLTYEADPAATLPRFARIVFNLDAGCLVYGDVRTLGCLWLVPSQGATGISGYDTLGPDAVGPDFTAAYLYDRLKGKNKPIKTFLLDQTNVAGLGNIYVDEALFLAGIRPSRRCSRIAKAAAARLYEAIRTVMASGLAHGGTTVRNFINGNGQEGQNQQFLNVYGREGQACKLCGTIIRYEKLGGRGTHYCPHCQK